MVDILLNPSKHAPGDEKAESAKRVAEKILQKANVDVPSLRSELEKYLAKQPKVSNSANKMQGQSLMKVLERARTNQSLLGDSFISAEALLLALCQEDEKFLKDALRKQNVSYDQILEQVQKAREKSGPANSRGAETNYEALSKYGIDFTAQAEEGKLDPVIGRDDEIRRAIQVLSRRRKNNPVLIGDPGVGKTAIAEGIAQRMVAGDVPDSLKPPCRLVGLDLGQLVAGATMRGEFEERLKSVLEEVTKSDGEIVLFIDELHTLVGAGAAQGSMDASNLLKPALSRGELRCVGATTINEYRQYIEKDKALERRFQQVLIDEPSPEDTVSILRGLKPRYELHHGVRIRDEALLAASKLSARYIPDRFLPDKAIDLVDEACAKLKNELTSKPIALDEIDRRIIQLEMERLSLSSDMAGEDNDRLRKIDSELEDLNQKSEELNSRWELEKGGVDRLNELKEEMNQVQIDIEKAERDYELNVAAQLKYEKMPKIEAEIKKLSDLQDAEDASGGGTPKMLNDEVTAEDIANVVAANTGIPPQKLVETERDKILGMAESLANRVIGQDEAIQVVTEAIQRSRAGLNDPEQPIASLMFLGPTGVGKTELSKALNEFMFDTEDMIRIDMSEYMEKHTVSRLIGAPPGYVGYEEGGQLTDAVRRRPYSVILLDEVEKAHPEVFNVFLQILDDGRVTDSKGTMVNFRNTVVIFTSNIGSQDILECKDKDEMRQKVEKAMKDHFRPEFLNRIDETVIFNSLDASNLRDIVKIEVKKLEKRLADRQITMTMTDAALDHVANAGFDPVYGARPLKRAIQRELETAVAKGVLKGDFKDGDSIKVDVDSEDNIYVETDVMAAAKTLLMAQTALQQNSDGANDTGADGFE
jgi:ATP-dependent Clp protease ATP-binding subunit ClpB